MSLDFIESFLLGNFIINIVILLYWFLWIYFFNEFVYKIHNQFFKINKESFNKIHYIGMLIYKVITFTLFGIPYIVLKMIGT